MGGEPAIPENRQAEYEGLVKLMLEHADPADADASIVADAVARGALQDGHLWRSMRLQDRAELRALLEAHFPQLAAGNTKDMRWKKYLYKRLCGWPGFEG